MFAAYMMLRRLLLYFVFAMTLFQVALPVNSLAGEKPGKAFTVRIPPALGLYSGEPQPLAPAQCGVCHAAVYRAVKETGGRHRFDCQKCHTVSGAHNPDRAGRTAAKPRCASCHDLPHGQQITSCPECHSLPHTPQKLAANAPITRHCFACHGSVRDKLATFKSRHSAIPCTTCHTSHGFKPSCVSCHKPHQQGQAMSTCRACHPAHMPRQVQYGKDLPSNICGSCHGTIYALWEKGNSKHKAVSCATCHKDRHRTVPACSDCHGMPHTPVFHQRFPRCLTCHINVHDIPVVTPELKRSKQPNGV